ncbi:hypothetical protein PR202_ga06856 [Eleusine coracana subsp. coracana]|uniref:Uncharacterized protein n=1 Tax=Eleusine coracana subsp. coracana TaxID=191504 RepID=A0AAV5BYF0_ELECO|nr:hypothetical protein PR202_ga06856 [Eleusine coracana subsp. coracana]
MRQRTRSLHQEAIEIPFITVYKRNEKRILDMRLPASVGGKHARGRPSWWQPWPEQVSSPPPYLHWPPPLLAALHKPHAPTTAIDPPRVLPAAASTGPSWPAPLRQTCHPAASASQDAGRRAPVPGFDAGDPPRILPAAACTGPCRPRPSTCHAAPLPPLPETPPLRSGPSFDASSSTPLAALSGLLAPHAVAPPPLTPPPLLCSRRRPASSRPASLPHCRRSARGAAAAFTHRAGRSARRNGDGAEGRRETGHPLVTAPLPTSPPPHVAAAVHYAFASPRRAAPIHPGRPSRPAASGCGGGPRA